MEQINFRVEKTEKSIIKILADIKGMSIAEFAKRSVLNEITEERVDIAFNLLKDGIIGRKRAWTLSGLSNLEFLNEWSKRHAEEFISEEITDKELELAKKIDLKKYLVN
ncbi:MAG: DUF6290 family protein [Promethearchaeota archaeon]